MLATKERYCKHHVITSNTANLLIWHLQEEDFKCVNLGKWFRLSRLTSSIILLL